MNIKYSFTDLFEKPIDLDKDKKVTIDQIVIPKIQRPYAQGRKDKVCKYVRDGFLTELFTALCNNELLELNFIYGIIRPSDEVYVMELLDGQQRITTLFLLYWYIVNRELQQGDEFDNDVRNKLKKFIYETRSSSTVFCQKLADFRIDLSNNTPKELICSSKWYFKSFDRDNSIVAMLTMLDAIHEKYNQCSPIELYKNLGNIQFYVKSLGYFNLSEELYIKMNARGLQLSPFENFKADLTNFITHSPYDRFTASVPLYDNTGESIPFHLNFSIKLDAKWVDIFWNETEASFDAAYMAFFYRYFACKYIVASKNDITDQDMRSDETIKQLYTGAEERISSNEYLGFQNFKNILIRHPEYIESLDRIFDVFYTYHKSDIRGEFVPQWEESKDNKGFDDFYCNTETPMTQTKLILFSATIEYIDAYKTFDKDTFKKWMRVVWNVVENTNIDSLTPTSSLIRKFSSIIRYIAQSEYTNFYSALASWREENSEERENRAVIEEIEKARRISENSHWEEVFVNAEKHPFFKGMVLFFYTRGMPYEEYMNRYELASQMFDVNGISPEYRKKHLLIRAIISRLNVWNNDNLKERYITERAESNKYLKNILASHEGVKAMFEDVLKQDGIETLKNKLKEYIDTKDEFVYWSNATNEDKIATDIAINRLRKDVKMYDWIAEEEKKNKECFRVYWFEGHIMFAIPRKWYAKLAIDTERAKVAQMICDNYGFEFHVFAQKEMYDQYEDCYDNEIWLRQNKSNYNIWIGFCLHHKVYLQIECNTEKMAKQLQEKFVGSKLNDEDHKWLHLPAATHFAKNKTYKDLSKRIEEIFKTCQQVIK
ncbi:DUF262 domain-containing protein [Bacteroides acidifaciens]|uniref:DUF262 domain-containing protein n=1 Tax=Bacteroides acidifaciens TaxID=85831 RepID=UPI00242CFB8B|nr:DUF262 domain-containing protein [Bacteroides acidifaciens]